MSNLRSENQRTKPAEQIAQREHHQGGRDRLRADDLANLADAVMRAASHVPRLLRRVVHPAGDPLSGAADRVAMPPETKSLMSCLLLPHTVAALPKRAVRSRFRALGDRDQAAAHVMHPVRPKLTWVV